MKKLKKVSRLHLCMRLWESQKINYKPHLTYAQFRDWLLAESEFDRLYDVWRDNDLKKEYKPIVRRISIKEGYVLHNLYIS